jgi:L-alanine-DL-glutamate epimerase-like enolase superfamily enzyme
MSVTSLETTAVRVPVRQRTSQSTRLLNQRDYLIVSVTDGATGVTGTGFSYIGTSGGASARTLVEEVLARTVLEGDGADDINGTWHRLYQESLMQGRRGIVLRAIAAIDLALWDLLARRAGLPLAVLLGGRTGAQPAYSSGGYYRPDAGSWTDAVQEEIRFNRSLGFDDHKIKVGGLAPREDADRVRAALDAMDGRGRLALDANNAYAGAAEAIAAMRVLERAAGDQGLWWIEEPLSPEDVAGHAAIARAVATPVATGEIHQTRWEFRQLLDQQAAAILQADVGVVGGVSEWLTIAHTAQSYGVPVAPHWHANVHGHLLSAVPNGLTVEYFAPQKGIYNLEELVTPETRLTTGQGTVIVPDRPGTGIEFDPEALTKYRI